MNPTTKRAPRCSPAFGRCPDCRTPLQLWETKTRTEKKVGSIYFNELGCPQCQAVKIERHHVACLCDDCECGIPADHKI